MQKNTMEEKNQNGLSMKNKIKLIFYFLIKILI